MIFRSTAKLFGLLRPRWRRSGSEGGAIRRERNRRFAAVLPPALPEGLRSEIIAWVKEKKSSVD